jgi:hypothetical protein
MTKTEFEEALIVGAKVRVGKQYAQEYGFTPGEVIELVEGSFEYDNGLYISSQSAPAIYNDDQKEFDSIYHLFGNDFEHFLDCEILKS